MIALFQDVFPVPMRYPSEMIIRDGLPRARKRAVMVELVSSTIPGKLTCNQEKKLQAPILNGIKTKKVDEINLKKEL